MPLVSVIIPTHNRARYAIPTIRSVLATSPDIEVIVCDTSEVDLISSEFTGHPNLKRLRLVRPNRPMSVVDNFNEALTAATGDYLVFIGDDDFVSKKIIDVARWAACEGIDSLKFSFPALYYWPDFKHASRGDVYAGTLHIAPFDGKIKPHSSKNALVYALENFGGGVFEMPRAYAGMLSSSLAHKIIKKYGALFGGVSPDIYSSALISIEAIKCVVVDFPIVIPGASGGSTTGQSASGGHYGGLRDNPHIAPFRDLIWDSRIPEFYSVPTVWSFSLLKAVEKILEKNPEIKMSPNFGRLILKCFLYHPAEYKTISNSLLYLFKSHGIFEISFQFLKAVLLEFFWDCARIKNRIVARHIKKNVFVISGLSSTSSASRALSEYIESCKNPLDF